MSAAAIAKAALLYGKMFVEQQRMGGKTPMDAYKQALQRIAAESAPQVALTDALPKPAALVKSSEWQDALTKRQSFNGWRINYGDCDFGLYTDDQMRQYAQQCIEARNQQGDARDAARYRFLRHADLDAMAAKFWPGRYVPEGEEFDAAIDAAIEQRKADKKGGSDALDGR